MATGETQGRKAQGQGQSGWGRAEREREEEQPGEREGRVGGDGGEVGVGDTGLTEEEESRHRHSVQTPELVRCSLCGSPPPATRPHPSPWEQTDGGDPPATSLRWGEATVTFRGVVGAGAPRAGRASFRPPRASGRPR